MEAAVNRTQPVSQLWFKLNLLKYLPGGLSLLPSPSSVSCRGAALGTSCVMWGATAVITPQARCVSLNASTVKGR